MVQEIYSSHFLEHIPHRKVLFLLRECHRVLKPGGKITVKVPDLEKNLKDFLEMDEGAKWNKGWETIFGNQKKQFEYHKTGFNKNRLKQLLATTGFINIAISYYKHRSIPSIRAEATKPVT